MRLVDEAVAAGARLRVVCEHLGLEMRTLQRWRKSCDDRRGLARRSPANRLSDVERKQILQVLNLPEFRDLSPKQIVARLADRGEYLASERTMYRILQAEGQLAHRAASRPPTPRPRPEHIATGPDELWSWDITYLRTSVRGMFFFLYLVEDVWSRKIVGWAVHERESDELAAELVARICREQGVDARGLILHSDNGAPMKGATMLATLQRLGVVPSFSRPGVSDDNPYSEALFRTLKYHPTYPSKPFSSIEHARSWVARFVDWYNNEHLHSAISFVTPASRHAGLDVAQLEKRRAVYAAAKERHPERWSGAQRGWSHTRTVALQPSAARAKAA
jgi:transposase InsO family protein